MYAKVYFNVFQKYSSFLQYLMIRLPSKYLWEKHRKLNFFFFKNLRMQLTVYQGKMFSLKKFDMPKCRGIKQLDDIKNSITKVVHKKIIIKLTFNQALNIQLNSNCYSKRWKSIPKCFHYIHFENNSTTHLKKIILLKYFITFTLASYSNNRYCHLTSFICLSDRSQVSMLSRSIQ